MTLHERKEKMELKLLQAEDDRLTHWDAPMLNLSGGLSPGPGNPATQPGSNPAATRQTRQTRQPGNNLSNPATRQPDSPDHL